MEAQDNEPSPIAARTRDPVQELLHYWFVQYNPLYFVSVACLLAGVSLVARELGRTDEYGQTVLFAVVQGYEFALIGCVAVLRRGSRDTRSAVILALLEVFFLLDPTFRVETLSMFGGAGIGLTAIWLALIPAKLVVLLRAFQLEAAVWNVLLPTAGACGIILLPAVHQHQLLDPAIAYWVSSWYGAALVAMGYWLRPRVETAEPLDEWQQNVLTGSVRACWSLWTGLYAYHLWAHILWIGPAEPATIFPALAPLLVVGPLFLGTERSVWIGVVAALWFTIASPAVFAPTAGIVAAALVLHGHRLGRERMYVGAVFCARVALWAHGWQSGPQPPWPDLFSFANILMVLVLLVLGVWRRLPSALFAVGVLLVATLRGVRGFDTIEWGLLLLSIAFLGLFAGVAVNLRLAPKDPD